MKEIDLHQSFVDFLYYSFPNKRELASIIEDILKIDRESIFRRLNNKVLFTAREIGIIANRLNISLDYILNKDNDSISLPLHLAIPKTIESVADYFKLYSNDILLLRKISKTSSLQIGYLFDTLPISFYAPYKHLYKYICFKSMSFFIKAKFFEEYSSWQIPKEFDDFKEHIVNCLDNAQSVFYIWNNPVIGNLMKDLIFSYKLRIVDDEDVRLIKNDLHQLLYDVTSRAQVTTKNTGFIAKPKDIYILNINIPFSCAYFHSPTETLIQYKTPCLYSKLCKNNKEVYTVYNWVNSMKSLSTLISDSGIIERNIFFEEQHDIVNSILKV